MPFVEKTAVYYENSIKHTNITWARNAEFSLLKNLLNVSSSLIKRIHLHNVKPLKVLYSVTQQLVFFTFSVLYSVTHHNNLEAHPNPLLEPLIQPINTRRLKRCWPFDLQGDISR